MTEKEKLEEALKYFKLFDHIADNSSGVKKEKTYIPLEL